MKRLFAVLICAVVILALASCESLPSHPAWRCHHRDANDNGRCDKCGIKYWDGRDIPDDPECQHRDADDDGYCDKCGIEFSDGDEHVHSFGEWVYHGEGKSCEGALFVRSCSGCDETEERTGTELDHKYVTVTTEPTCLTGGYDTHTCTVCSNEYVDNVTDPIDHVCSDEYTFDEDYHWRICTTCNEKVDYAEHSYDEDSTCTVCGRVTDGIIYALSDDGTYAMVVGLRGNITNIEIAAEYKGVPVTTICESAFIANDDIESVNIPDSVTSIGDRAFYACFGLVSVYIGDGLTNAEIPEGATGVGAYAFYACENLAEVTLGNSITSIGDYAFYACDKITSIVIPDSVTSIGDYAFYASDELSEITFGNGITSIGNSAFKNCDKITSIVIPGGVTSIGDEAFFDCDGLVSVYIGDGLTNAEIPEGATGVGAYAFYDCENLAEVTLGNSITSIGDYAFYACDKITSIVITDSVTSIGDKAFYACDKITSIVIPDSVTSIGDYAFYACDGLTDVYFTGTEEEWNAIEIGNGDFYLNMATKHFNYIPE